MSGNIDHHTVELDLRDSIVGSKCDRAEIRTKFQFDLCRKQTALGPLPLDQWWISKPGLYGERGNDSSNRQVIVDCFWSLCQAEGDALNDRPIQEVYILATLLPHARSNGSRRVFADASLAKYDAEETSHRSVIVEQLENMLQGSRNEELDVQSFYRQSGDILGPPEYDDQVHDCYTDFVAEILGDGCDALSHGGLEGLQISLDRWSSKMKKIGRRNGYAIEKNVLDVLSYECRAAFHQCYSAVWLSLLEKLQVEFSFSEEGVLFHRLWHLDQVLPSNESDEHHVHLFHGHIFGLHPACGDFILTQTGAELVGELLTAPKDQSCQHRFLNGLQIAVHHYAIRNEVAKELRKKQPTDGNDLEIVECQQLDRKYGRRPTGRRKTDGI